MRKASLGTLFLTVFLDLLGFGLVVPFLPGVARSYGASNLVAALLGAAFSAMQFLFIPLWGRLSDRVGRRPVLLWSIAASAGGMVLLGVAHSLPMLFLARLWTGMATANIAVAQAYIADVTTPERRARGMGLIGMAFGLGFIFGPFIGGELGRVAVLGRPGALAAFVAAGLSAINFLMALLSLPESRVIVPGGSPPPEGRRRVAPLDGAALRLARSIPGVPLAVVIGFSVTLWFAGMEQTFRLFTEDAFAMGVASTGRVFGLMGLVTALVQGGLIHRLTRRFGEVRLVQAGAPLLGAGFALIALAPGLGGRGRTVMVLGACTMALGYGLIQPGVSSYTSRQAGREVQGAVLGILQSMSALSRVIGPAAGGLLYQLLGLRAPYAAGALGMFLAAVLASRLPPLARDRAAGAAAAVSRGPA
jgi:DHA1 family tetracycline resistance protein-like MFS transporter